MRHRLSKKRELLWARVVVRKWLNISTVNSDYSADTEDEDSSEAESEAEVDVAGFEQCVGPSRLQVNSEKGFQADPCAFAGSSDALPKLTRRNSETFRAQYINTNEIRICVGTWNVGGRVPPDDFNIDDWIDTKEPADIYVLGLQEIVPLNAVNIFGAEDDRPVSKWENIIRDALNRIRPQSKKFKSYSDPPSPSKFKSSEDVADIKEDISTASVSDTDDEIHPLDGETDDFDELRDGSVINQDVIVNSGISDSADDTRTDLPIQDIQIPNILDKLFCLRVDDSPAKPETQAVEDNGKLKRLLSGSERIGLSWPEPPLNLINRCSLQRQGSFKPVKSLRATKSFQTFGSFKSATNKVLDISLLAKFDLESFVRRKRKPVYVRIVSKQMVGIFLTIWVRRSLRKHIQNLRVSTVGVGVMGYIGNKGAVSVSMSIYQTLFCFVCTHLTSGEKDGDELKRNADVQEIRRRTQFHSFKTVGLPKGIHDHERIIWLGDLNYRINLPYEKTCELISKKEWSKLLESDQLLQEMKKGRSFDGWSEGNICFPPTYKYEINSKKYCGEDPKAGRRNPAWCDRILSYGKGMRLLSYRRTELKHSDHRPVTATYAAEVEVFSPRKLQRALTFTDAEVESQEAMANM